MSIHTVIVLVLLYAFLRSGLRAIFRRKPKDPMAGRLVQCSPEEHAQAYAWAKHQHDTFDARHTVDFYAPPDPIAQAKHKYDCVKRAWAAGYATDEEKWAAHAELTALTGSPLAWYLPKNHGPDNKPIAK
jgi:hypothetical protein